MIKNKSKNEFLTSDIKLEKDSAGYYTATHRHQGMLYDWTSFTDRREARQAAVEELKSIKSTGKTTWGDDSIWSWED